MTYGNYDAGQSRPISNPFLDGGVRNANAGKTEFNFGFNRVADVDGAKAPWEITRTTQTPDARIGGYMDAFTASFTPEPEMDRADAEENNRDFVDFADKIKDLRGVSPEILALYNKDCKSTADHFNLYANQDCPMLDFDSFKALA